MLEHDCFFVVYLSPDGILQWTSEVVCLQEVQFDTEENGSFSLPAWLKDLDGYTACLPGDKYLTQMAERNERVLANRVAIGCAVLFRSDRLVQREETARSDPNRLVSACLEGHPESGIRHLGRTAFFSVHLDAQSEEERVEQLRKCLEKARALGTRDAVFAGDMNAECFPGSCVRAIISPEVPSAEEMARQCAAALRIAGTDDADEEQKETKDSSESAEPTAQQLEQWKVLWDKAAQAPKEYRMCLQRVPTGRICFFQYFLLMEFWCFRIWIYFLYFSIFFCSFGLSVFESWDALDLARPDTLCLWPWDVRRALCDLEFSVLADDKWGLSKINSKSKHHPEDREEEQLLPLLPKCIQLYPCDSMIPVDLSRTQLTHA